MSIGGWIKKEAFMPVTEAKWWKGVVTGDKPFTLSSHNQFHASATRELGNNWFTNHPDATAAMILATIFSGGSASAGGAGGAGAGAGTAGGAAATDAGAASATGAGATGASSTAGGMAAGDAGAYGAAGYGAAGQEVAASQAVPGMTADGAFYGGATDASTGGGAAYTTPKPANTAGAGQGTGLLGNFGNSAKNVSAGLSTYNQYRQATAVPRAQPQQMPNQQPDFTSLLSPDTTQSDSDQRRKQQALIIQGLLSGNGYGR